jgi:hypothetical protein
VGRTLEETVVEVANILDATYIENGRKPINYLKFILHPTDFALTVENIFHISFLINNNKVNVFVGEYLLLPVPAIGLFGHHEFPRLPVDMGFLS